MPPPNDDKRQRIELGDEPPATVQPSETREASPSARQRIELGTRGAGFGVRAGASIRQTPEGKLNFLRAVFGPENVRIIDRSPLMEGSGKREIFIRDPRSEAPDKWFPFDERTVSVKDVTADILGPAVQVLPTLFAGTNPLTVGAAGAAGAATRQIASEFLPGESAMSPGERALDVGLSFGFAAGSQAIVNTGARVFDAIRPHNIVGRQVRSAEATAKAVKGRRLSEQTGIPLTLGEETGTRAALYAEGISRRNIAWADFFYNFQTRQLRAATQRLQTVLDDVAPKRGPFEIGDDIVRAFDDVTDKAIELRRAQAAVDFGEVSRLSAGRPIVNASNLRAEIGRWIAELDVPGAGDATARVVNQAKRLLGSIDDGGGQYTAEQTQRLLQVYTQAQRGTGQIFRDMDKAQSRLVAGRLKDALLRDLDDAAQGGEDAVATALRLARDNYRLNTSAINEIGDSALSRLIGNRTSSPEAIAQKFLKLAPSQVRASMSLLERASPQTALAVRRSFVESAIANAREIVPTRLGESGVRFSASRFLKAIPDDETLRAAGFSRAELVDVKQVAKVLERIADKELQGSPTMPFAIAWDAVRGLLTFNPHSLIRSAGAVITPRKIARAVLTPEGRQALRTLTETSVATRKGFQAAVTFSALTGAGLGFSSETSDDEIAARAAEDREMLRAAELLPPRVRESGIARTARTLQ